MHLADHRVVTDSDLHLLQNRGFVCVNDAIQESSLQQIARQVEIQRPFAKRSTRTGFSTYGNGRGLCGPKQQGVTQAPPSLRELWNAPEMHRLIALVLGREAKGTKVAVLHYAVGDFVDLHTDVAPCEVTVLTSLVPFESHIEVFPSAPRDGTALVGWASNPSGGVRVPVRWRGLTVFFGSKIPHRRPPAKQPIAVASMCYEAADAKRY